MSQVSYATLRSLRIGEGSNYPFAAMPSGIGVNNDRVATVVQGNDGQKFLGSDRLLPSLLTFTVHITGVDITARLAAADALRAAWAPVRTGTVQLTLALNGVERLVVGRPGRCDIDVSKLAFGTLRARCTFETSDARMFEGGAMSSLTLGLTAGGGMVFPLTFPLTFGAGSDSDGSAVNIGNIDAPWIAVIDGPVDTPRITLGETGEFLELDGNILAGSTVVIDSAAQSILLDGSPRASWQTLLSRWWSLAPGTNTVRYRASSGSGSCSFTWRSAWL